MDSLSFDDLIPQQDEAKPAQPEPSVSFDDLVPQTPPVNESRRRFEERGKRDEEIGSTIGAIGEGISSLWNSWGELTPEEGEAQKRENLERARQQELWAQQQRADIESRMGRDFIPGQTLQEAAATEARDIAEGPAPTKTAAKSAAEGFARETAQGVVSLGTAPGIAIDFIDWAATGDTNESGYTKALRGYSSAIESALPGDPARRGELFDQLAAGGGSMTSMIVGGGALRAAGVPFKAAQYYAGISQGGVSGYEDAEANDATAGQKYASFFLNAGLGATEAIPISRAFDRLNDASGGKVQQILANSAANSLEEFVQELGQGLGANFIANTLAGYDVDRSTSEGVLNQAAVGFILGGIMGGGITAVSPNRPEQVTDKGGSEEQTAALKSTATPASPAAPPAIDPAVAQAVTGTPVQPVAPKREQLLAIARRRDQRAQAPVTPEVTAPPAPTPEPPAEQSQPVASPNAAGTEPPTTVGVGSAAPPVSTPRKVGDILTKYPGEGYRVGPFSFDFNSRGEGARYIRVRDRSGNNGLQGRDGSEPNVDVTDIWSSADPNQFDQRQGNKVGINSLGNNVPRELVPVFRDYLEGKIDQDEALTRVRDVEIGGAAPPAAEAPATPNEEITANVPAPPAEEVPPSRANFYADSPETIKLQHAALRDPKNDRKAVVYSADTPIKDLPDKPQGKFIVRRTFKIDGVSTIVDFNTAKTNYGEVQKAIRTGKLNELLDLGPYNQQEVAESAAAGAAPVAVTERTPDGTEVKSATGTEETAPEQMQALEDTKSEPENTIVVEDPAKVIGERIVGGRRVLEDVSPEGTAKRKAAEEARAKQEAARLAKAQAAAEEAARAAERAADRTKNLEELNTKVEEKAFGSIEEEALSRAQVGGSNLQNQDKEAIVRGAAISKGAFDTGSAILPDVVASGQDLRQFGTVLNNILTDARTKFVEAQKALKEADKGRKLTAKAKRALGIRTKGDYPTVAGPVIWLSEAASLSRRIDLMGDDKVKINDLLVDVNDFLSNSGSLKEGDDAPLRGKRREKAAEIAASRASDAADERRELGGAQDMEFTESVRDEENAAGGRQFEAAADTEAAVDSPDAREVPTEVTPDSDGPVNPRERWRQVRDMRREAIGRGKPKPEPKPEIVAEEGVNYTTVKATKAPVVETKKKRTLLKRETVAGEETFVPLDESTILQTVTFAEALQQAGTVPGSGLNRTIINRMLTRLGKQVGNIKVHVVPQESLDAMYPDRADNNLNGYYDPENNYIVVSDMFVATGSFDARLLAHEGTHAYLSMALDLDKTLKQDFQQILDYARSVAPNKDVYGLTNIHEMLAEAMSNPEFQNFLMGIKLPKELASKYDMPGGTMWQLFVEAIRRHLGLGRNDVDALSYVLRLGDRAEARINKMSPRERKFFQQAWAEGLLASEGRQRSYKQELTDAGVPEDAASEIETFINEELGKSVDPATLPLLMGDFIREFGKPVTTGGNPPPPSTPAFGGTPAQPAPPSAPLRNKTGWIRGLATKLNTLDYIRQNYNRYFDDKIDPYVKAIQKREDIVSSVSEKHDKDAADLVELMRRNPKEATELANIAMEATRLNVRIEGDNSHLGKEAKRGLQGKKRLPALQARFANLSPEARELYRRMVANYRETHNDNIRALAYNILVELELKNRLSNSDLMMLLDKVVGGTLTKADADLIGDPQIYSELKAATSLKSIKGDYFPQMRFGDFVVLTKDVIPNPGITSVTLKGNGRSVPVKTKVEGNTVSFRVDPTVRGAQTATNRAVNKFIADNDLTLLGVRKRFVDRKTNQVVAQGEQIVGQDYDVVFEIDLQTQGVRFFESRKEAESFRKQTSQPGFTDVSEVLDRREDIADKLISGSALTAVTKRIDNNKDIPAWQRKQMKQAVAQAIISQMPGNRAQSRYQARRNVKGASNDIARAAVTYGQSAGNYYATLTTAPEIRKSFTALTEFEAKNQMRDGAAVRSQIMNELRARQETLDDPLYYNKFLQNVATLSFFDKLVSPAYSIINFQQAIGNGLPHLGGQYGNARASMAIANAYRKIGTLGTIAGGVKNTAVAVGQLRRSAIDTDDLIGSIRKNLGSKYEALVDELVERGLVSPNSGFEIGQAIVDGSGKFNTALAKFDRIARQLPNSVEAVNRMVVAVAAFDLATSRGKSRQQAIEEAYNAVSLTQGDYRRSNNPRFMNKPGLSWALQFKKYAVLQTQLIGDYYAKALRGSTKQERKIARKQLLTQMAVQTMYAGALGLPGLELVKLGFGVASLLGVGEGWDEFEEDVKEFFDESIGQSWSELLRKGVVTRAIGIDVSDRMSQADLWTGFMPSTLDRDGLTSYVGSLLLGAPGSTLFDWFDAGREAADGNFAKALEKLVPIKMVADTARAIYEVERGRMTEGEAVLKSIGFQPSRIANIGEQTGAEIREGQKSKRERNKIIKAYLDATNEGERRKVISRMREYNKTANKRSQLSEKFLENIRKKEQKKYEVE